HVMIDLAARVYALRIGRGLEDQLTGAVVRRGERHVLYRLAVLGVASSDILIAAQHERRASEAHARRRLRLEVHPHGFAVVVLAEDDAVVANEIAAEGVLRAGVPAGERELAAQLR